MARKLSPPKKFFVLKELLSELQRNEEEYRKFPDDKEYFESIITDIKNSICILLTHHIKTIEHE